MFKMGEDAEVKMRDWNTHVQRRNYRIYVLASLRLGIDETIGVDLAGILGDA